MSPQEGQDWQRLETAIQFRAKVKSSKVKEGKLEITLEGQAEGIDLNLLEVLTKQRILLEILEFQPNLHTEETIQGDFTVQGDDPGTEVIPHA